MKEQLNQSALHYHRYPQAGKINIKATKPLLNQRDLSLAYSPGVAAPCLEIEKDPIAAAYYTSRNNLVGVISNGTAVLGLGNIGPLASKPVMEGKAILFKNFADVNAYDIEVDEMDVDKFCDIVAALEPTFGGINLEDIKAPQCFEIEKKLRQRMNIPVFHDDQHGTAIVSAAAIINGLLVVGKNVGDVKIVVSGAGSAAMACTNLLLSIGADIGNVLMLDSRGVIHSEREGLDQYKQKFAATTQARSLRDAIVDCDVFLGVSQPDLIDVEMLKSMAPKPLILAMANPNPEIKPELVFEHRPDAVMATGRSDYPNQVNNVLCFPFLFRGALDVGATTINEEMKVACVKALADLAHSESSEIVAQYYQNEKLIFGAEYILPKPFDPRLVTTIAPAVAQAAIDSGVAMLPFDNIETYRKSLEPLVYRTGNVMRPIFEKAQSKLHKVVYSDGISNNVLRAVQEIVIQNFARPVLIGDVQEIEKQIKKLGLKIELDVDVDVIEAQVNRIEQACKMLDAGQVHAAITGPEGRLHEQANLIKQHVSMQQGVEQLAVMQCLLLDEGTYFITDTSLNENPTAEELANITILAAKEVEKFGMEPRVALLSHSNFASHPTESSRKMAKTKELVNQLAPGLIIDGEMKGSMALNSIFRESTGKSALTENANLLVMPNLDSANITVNALLALTKCSSVGPIMLGTSKPIHAINSLTTSRGIVNLTSLAVASIDT